jgi:hypothetical protein
MAGGHCPAGFLIACRDEAHRLLAMMDSLYEKLQDDGIREN